MATDLMAPLPIDPVYERTVTMTKSPRHVITITCSLCSHNNEDQPELLSLRDLNVNYRLQLTFQLLGHRLYFAPFMVAHRSV